MRSIRIRAATLALVAASGCTNALYFYETGKISLTVEARPDSSEPVQGNLGFKQRTAVVAPQKQSDHEAPAMISSFRFSRSPGFLGTVDVQTALVTGAAATALQPAEQQEAAQAVAGIPSYDSLATRAVAKAAHDKTDGELRTLTDIPYDQLTPAQIARLGTITGAGAGNYTKDFHDSVHAAISR